MPIVYERVKLITEEFTLGNAISKKITQQLLDLNISGPVELKKEENKGGAAEE